MAAAPNVFLISPGLSEEDRFTAHWHYLLARAPALAQRVMEYFSSAAGLRPTQLVETIDHPPGTREDRPDFELVGKRYSILFEHKLLAGLGPNQLERYLKLARERPHTTHLALVSSRTLEVPLSVLRNPNYLRPKSGFQHFVWQEVAKVLRSDRSSITKEFLAYMEWKGLTFLPWAGLGDPFIHQDAEQAFRQVLVEVARNTRPAHTGCKIVPATKSLGVQFQKPMPAIHLVYFAARDPDFILGEGLSGRLFTASVWVKQSSSRQPPILHWKSGCLDSKVGPIHFEGASDRAKWDSTVYCQRRYAAPLAGILGTSVAEATKNTGVFVQEVLKHLDSRKRTGLTCPGPNQLSY